MGRKSSAKAGAREASGSSRDSGAPSSGKSSTPLIAIVIVALVAVAGGYAYMNAMLEKSAQENFAIDMGYNPTVSNATVAPDLNQRIGFTAEEKARLIDLDYAYIAKNDSALKEWWDKVFKA